MSAERLGLSGVNRGSVLRLRFIHAELRVIVQYRGWKEVRGVCLTLHGARGCGRRARTCRSCFK